AVGVVVLLRGLVRRAAEALVERVRLLALVGDVKGGVAVLLAGVAEVIDRLHHAPDDKEHAKEPEEHRRAGACGKERPQHAKACGKERAEARHLAGAAPRFDASHIPNLLQACILKISIAQMRAKRKPGLPTKRGEEIWAFSARPLCISGETC